MISECKEHIYMCNYTTRNIPTNKMSVHSEGDSIQFQDGIVTDVLAMYNWPFTHVPEGNHILIRLVQSTSLF